MRIPLRRSSLRLSGLAALLALAGCAHYEAKPLDPADILQRVQSRSLDDRALRQQVATSTGHAAPPWTVSALQGAAVALSPRYEAARSAAEAARQAAARAGQRPVPSLVVPLEYTTNAKPEESPSRAGVGLDFTVDTGGQRGYRAARAAHLAKAAAFDAQADLWRIQARVRETLLEVWSGRRQSSQRAAEVDARDDLLELVERRWQLGAAGRPEVDLARSQWLQARKDEMTATRVAGTAAVAAAGAIGIAPSHFDPARLDLSEFASLPDDLAPADDDVAALVARTDVEAALARYEAAQSALQLAVADQYPEIRLGLGYTFDAGARKIGVSIAELPLTLLRDHRPAIDQAVAQRHQAGARLQQVVADALIALSQARVALAAARAADDTTLTRLAAEERLLAATQRAFEHGEVDRGDLLRARVQLVSAQADRELAWLEVQKAVGALQLALHAAVSSQPQGDNP